MILVTGATGLNGGALVRLLSARGVKVRALVRSSAKAKALSELPNVEIVEGDMAHPDTLTAPLRGVERAMLISTARAGKLAAYLWALVTPILRRTTATRTP